MVRIVSVVSGKGGVGKTTLVANLGVVLSTKFRKDVVIVDCNITTSHLSLYLGMYYTPVTLNDVLRGDAKIHDAIYEHISGLRVIPASLKLKDLRGVDMIHLKNHLSDIRKFIGKPDIIVLDAGPGMGREAITTMKASDEIIFITTPYIPAVSDVIKCKQIADENNISLMGIVMNMVFGERHELTKKEIEELTELPVIANIPFDKRVLRSLSMRIPIALLEPRSRVSKEIEKVAAFILGEEMKKETFFDMLKRLIFGERFEYKDIREMKRIAEEVRG